MKRKYVLFGLLAVATLLAMSLLAPGIGNAQADPRVQKAMASLKDKVAQLGRPSSKARK